jgi:hypothetical protein
MDINDILKYINLPKLSENIKSAFISLINLIENLSSENRQLKNEIQQLRDENNRLKGEQGKPKIKANTKDRPELSSEKERNRDNPKIRNKKKRAKKKDININRSERCYIDKSKLPKDAVFKGYKKVVVQDLKIQTDNVEFHKEIYYSKSLNKTYIAELPQGYKGEFGPTIKGLTIILKNVCNMSEPKISEFLKTFGIFISMGKISNILIKDHPQFHQQKTAIVAAGLQTTVYQGIDDTKARVNGKNYHTHILGNRYYTAFFTEQQKNRLTVLKILMNKKELNYCLNHHALHILQQLVISKQHFKRLKELEDEKILNQQQLENLLTQNFPKLGKQTESKILEATAIAAYRKGVGHTVVKALLCDDAPQFKSICKLMALCWVHDGRHYKKLSPVFKYNATLITKFLTTYWKYYRKLVDYKKAPALEKADKLSNEFDQLFTTVTGYNELDDRIFKTLMKKQQLLLVLKYPEIPLHNNDMELGARVCVRKRDVSLHTMTKEGTKANDTFLTIVETCKKLDINPFQYIFDNIKRTNQFQSLALIIIQKHLEACLV